MRSGRGALALACCLVIFAAASPSLGAAQPNRAALIVGVGEGETARMCVFFEEDEISGQELMERSGLRLVTDASSLGTAICKIGNSGCASDDCFCRYPTFWGYWNRDRDTDDWTFADRGAADRKVRNGSMDGWTWGRDGKPTPPDASFESICGRGATNTAATTRRTAEPLARPGPLSNERGNYLAFAGFLIVFAALAFALRRRRATRSDT